MSLSFEFNRPKITQKRSLRNKLFFRHNENKPKLKNGQSSSSDRIRKKRWKSLQLRISTSSDSKHQRQPSRLGIFIQEALEKLTHSNSPSRSLSHTEMNLDSNSFNENTLKITEKSHWKPSLDIIFEDEELLSALIKFMERSYNDESILFLQSVRQLNTDIDAFIQYEEKEKEIDIEQQIISIFQTYIAASAEYQVNLSYECFLNTTHMCQREFISKYNRNEKKQIFDHAVAEIQHLIYTSVLSLFYDSDEFQVLAQTKTPVISPLSSPIIAPIVLSQSCSSMVADSNASAFTDNEAAVDDGFDNDELIFLDEGYLNV